MPNEKNFNKSNPKPMGDVRPDRNIPKQDPKKYSDRDLNRSANPRYGQGGREEEEIGRKPSRENDKLNDRNC